MKYVVMYRDNNESPNDPDAWVFIDELHDTLEAAKDAVARHLEVDRIEGDGAKFVYIVAKVSPVAAATWVPVAKWSTLKELA